MELKDKLNLLWKYLLLAVIVIALFMLPCRYDSGRMAGSHGAYAMQDCEMGGGMRDCDMHAGRSMGAGMKNIRVEKVVENGDTNIVVWVNGEKVDNPEAFMMMHKGGDDAHKMMCKDKDGKQHKMIKKAHIHMDDDDDDDD